MIRPKRETLDDQPRHDHPRRAHNDAAMPWADDPWLKGHALGETRDILICDVETAGGITGMGYLSCSAPE